MWQKQKKPLNAGSREISVSARRQDYSDARASSTEWRSFSFAVLRVAPTRKRLLQAQLIRRCEADQNETTSFPLQKLR